MIIVLFAIIILGVSTLIYLHWQYTISFGGHG